MSAPKLTAKQEKFCQEYIKCGNQSEAYRLSYDVGEDTKPKCVWEEACKLMASPKVSQRVFDLQEMAQERTLTTVDSLTKELNEAKALAVKTNQPSAMTGAIMGKAKLHGLDIQKIDMNLNGALTMDRLSDGRKRAAERNKPED